MVGRNEPDDLCPSCGVPVPFHRRGRTCPYCGHEFGLPQEGPETTGYLTAFGYGMCGLIVGGQVGAGLGLAAGVRLGDPRLALFPLAGAVACACAFAGIGSKLHAGAKRGFEALLFALVLAGLVVFLLAFVGVSSLDTLSAVAVCVLAIGVPTMWRLLYGRKPKT